ncbi:hypothetical protein 13VV501A_gene0046 [Vibrio phage 13VV501A]|nr:hypothetical protein 13VV501A_gene0046 [Vibrio phage 13VV501A]
MITVHYYPTDSDATTSTAPTLTDWFVEQFGADMQLPHGLRITHGSATREHDVTDEISLGDPNGHLTRITGEYHVVEVPGVAAVWVPLVISLVVSVAAVLLAPKPNLPNAANRRQDSSTNQLGNRTNDARPGERYQDVRGFEPAVYADLLMTPHRRFEDNREVEFVYGTATTGLGLISSPRDGITPYEAVQGAQLDVYGPGTSPGNGSPVQSFGTNPITFPVVASTLSRNVNGQILAPPNQLEVTPLDYKAYANGTIEAINAPEEFDFRNIYDVGDPLTLVDWYAWQYAGEKDFYVTGSGDFGEYSAYYRRDLSGAYEVVAVDRATISVTPTANWSLFGSGYLLRDFAFEQNQTPFPTPEPYYYLDNASPPGSSFQWTRRDFYSAVQGVFDGTVGPFKVPEGSTSGWVNLLAQSGIRLAGSADYAYDVTCRFTIYELDENDQQTGNFTLLDPITLSSNPILITDQVGVTQDFTIPYARAEISGKRTSNTDKNFSGTVVDEVKWAAMFTVEPLPVVTPQDVTSVYAKIRQTPSALGVQERKLNFGVTRYERRYLGNGQMSAALDTPSAEFADAVVGLALDPYVGRNVTLDQLNIDSLYAVQEEIAAYFGTRDAIRFGYSFSTSDMTFEDHLTLIARAVFCRVFRIGNTYEFRFDRPRAKGETALLLNHRLKYANSDKRERSFTDSSRKGYDGVVVKYKSAKTLVFEDLRIPEGTFPTNPKEIELSGVTSEQVAKWHALREWNKIRYKRVFHETEAHSLARGLVPGDRIVMANDTLTRSQNGQVLEQRGLELRLADGVNTVAGELYDITLLYRSGTVESIRATAGSIGPQWVSLFALPSEELYTGNLEMRTAYNLYPAADADKDDMMVESMTVAIKNGQERIRVQAVNYDVRYWEGDPQTVSTGSFSTAFSDAFDKGYNRP